MGAISKVLIHYATRFCAYLLTADFVAVKQQMKGLKHGEANGRNFKALVYITLRFSVLIDRPRSLLS